MATGGATTGKRPQGPNYGQVAAFKQMEMRHMPQSIQLPIRGGFLKDPDKDKANFPVSQYPEMIAEDTRQATRAAVVEGKGNFSGQQAGLIYSLTDEDFKYYEAKEAAEEFAAFERWVATCFDFTKPTEVDRFARMFPDFFERRLATLKNVADANVHYAEIVMRGPQSADDMLYLWLVQTGKIPLIDGPLWDPSKWAKPDATTTKLAIFNPWKMVSGKTGSLVPYAIGTDGNWTYPGLPVRAGETGQSDSQTTLIKEMFTEQDKRGIPSYGNAAAFFGK